MRRASEDDNSTVQSYDDDEEEGLDEIARREAAPKQVRCEARNTGLVSASSSELFWFCSLIWQTCCCTRPSTPSSTAWAASPTRRRTCVSGRSAWLTLVSGHLRTRPCLPRVLTLASGFRAVRGAVGHGDAVWSEDRRQARGGVSGARVWSLRRADRVHPAGHGGLICVPARSPASLVGLGRCQPTWLSRAA